jgi:hypothetical protein
VSDPTPQTPLVSAAPKIAHVADSALVNDPRAGRADTPTLLYHRAVLADAPQIFALIDCKLESSRVPPMPSPTVL